MRGEQFGQHQNEAGGSWGKGGGSAKRAQCCMNNELMKQLLVMTSLKKSP